MGSGKDSDRRIFANTQFESLKFSFSYSEELDSSEERAQDDNCLARIVRI